MAAGPGKPNTLRQDGQLRRKCRRRGRHLCGRRRRAAVEEEEEEEEEGERRVLGWDGVWRRWNLG